MSTDKSILFVDFRSSFTKKKVILVLMILVRVTFHSVTFDRVIQFTEFQNPN